MERLDRVELQWEVEAEVRGNNRPRRTGGLRDGAPPRRGRPPLGPAAPVCVTRGGGGHAANPATAGWIVRPTEASWLARLVAADPPPGAATAPVAAD